jgi:histidyl-tRNA synthetase
MDELKLLSAESTPAPILIVQFVADRLGDYQRLARHLRAHGLNTEVFPDPKPLGKQLKYADRKGFRCALIAGPEEFAAGVWQVKDLKSGSAEKVVESQLMEELSRICSGNQEDR